MSLHDEYIDQLSESTNDLKIKLQQLELNLRKSIRDAETKLERTVKQSESSSQSELSRVRDRVAHMLTSFEEKLFNDSLTMLHYQNKTDGNKAALLKFLLTLGSLQERQAIFQRNEETMRDKLDHLDKQLQEERVEKEAMVSKSEMLQNTLTKMEGLYTDLVKELRDCMNRTTGLTDKYDRLETAMRERDHLIPQTLKGNKSLHIHVIWYRLLKADTLCSMGVGKRGGAGELCPPPNIRGGGPNDTLPPRIFLRGPRPTRLSIFHS